MAKNKTNSSFGWGSFFKYFSLTTVFAAFSTLSILFGLKVIDIAGISFPLAVTLGGLAGVMLLFSAVFKAVSAYNAYKSKLTYELLPDSDDEGFSDAMRTDAKAAPQNGQKKQDDPKKVHDSPHSPLRGKTISDSPANYAHLFKFVLLGDAQVGKSSLLSHFTDNPFTERYAPTIGVDFKFQPIELDNKVIKLQVWDTAGQERFRPITTSYYRDSLGILLVFDVNNEISFNNVKVWKEKITQNAPEANVILVGNKCDDESTRVVSKERAEALAKELRIPYMETSAKTGENVENCFIRLAQTVYKCIVGVGQKSEEKTPPTNTETSIFSRLFN